MSADATELVENVEAVEAAAESTGDAPGIAAEYETAEEASVVEETLGGDSSSTAGAFETDGSGEARMTRIELNSGAQRSADFVSADVAFTTADGTFELVMCGLKEENRAALVEALEEHFVVGWHVPLTFVDEAFPDAEKYDTFPAVNNLTGEGFYDSNHCWAASASNMLWVSGWAPRLVNPKTGEPFSSEDDVFEYFNASFSDAGGEATSGIDWFFMGEYFLVSYGRDAHLFKVNNPDDGLMKDFVSTLAKDNLILAEPTGGQPELIEEVLRVGPGAEDPAVFEASIGSLKEGAVHASSHSVTVAGVIVDRTAKELADRFKAIAIIDSDNDSVPSEAMGKGSDSYGYGPSVEVKNADKEARPNTVTFYGLRLIEDAAGIPCWEIMGYSMDAEGHNGEPTILYKMVALPLYDEQLPKLYSEAEKGGGTATVAENVDLAVEIAYTTDETEPIVNLYGFNARDHTVTEFEQGAPITLSYLVQNRSGVRLDEAYAGQGWFTTDWKVIRDSDGTVVAQGQSICELPPYWPSQVNYVTALNADGDEVAVWAPGAYTAVLEVNADRSIAEAYYLNNLPVEVRFVVTPSGDWVPEDESEEPDAAVPSTNSSGEAASGDGCEVRPAAAPAMAGSALPPTGDEVGTCLWVAIGLAAVAVALLVVALALRINEKDADATS